MFIILIASPKLPIILHDYKTIYPLSASVVIRQRDALSVRTLRIFNIPLYYIKALNFHVLVDLTHDPVLNFPRNSDAPSNLLKQRKLPISAESWDGTRGLKIGTYCAFNNSALAHQLGSRSVNKFTSLKVSLHTTTGVIAFFSTLVLYDTDSGNTDENVNRKACWIIRNNTSSL